jgi:hypothetical protein
MSWVVVLLIVGLVVYMTTQLRTHRGSIGPGASGAVYDMLNEDKRKAIEIIVEGRAEARDPEDADGNLPDLEDPRAARRAPKGHGPIR